MKKIGILVHQYGAEIVGGAENYARQLAIHLAKRDDCRVTVFTTTSKTDSTWADYYPKGRTVEEGVELIRFSPRMGRNPDFTQLCNDVLPIIQSGMDTDIAVDDKWIEWEGPNCPDMMEHIKSHQDEYDAFIFLTYIFYIAVKGIPEVFDKAVFIPTAHDEPWIKLSIMKDIFHMPRYFGFLTEEERDYVHKTFKNEYIPHKILDFGIDIPQNADRERFRGEFHIGDAPYIIYVGRIDASKGCDELVRFFRNYKKKNKSDLKLVLVGTGNMHVPESDDIVRTGFVSDERKYDAIDGALAMVTPSRYESLNIALLEALSLKIPIIANARCEVLKGQCIRSNAGLFYENEEEFGCILDYYISNPDAGKKMGENGLAYIESRYRWELVVNNVIDIVDDIKAVNEKINNIDACSALEPYKLFAQTRDFQIPVWREDAVTVLTSSDNHYAPYLAVTLNSVIQNSSKERFYDLIVLTNNIDDENIRKIQTLKEDYPNISVRFVYLSEVMKKLEIKISNNYNEVTYYRLLIPGMMKSYEKIVYIDSDVAMEDDVAKLWDTDMRGYLLAGTNDILVSAWQNYDSGARAYFRHLGLDEVGKYIQAGVIVWNIEEMNRQYRQEEPVHESITTKYVFADQDILNIFCKNRIKYIDQAWDVLNFTNSTLCFCKKYLPRFMERASGLSYEKPRAIHYCEGSFPVNKPERMFSQMYWKYAYKTPFMDILLKNRISNIKKYINEKKEDETHPDNEKRLLIKGNEFVQISNESIIIEKGGELFGPNVILHKGKHVLSVYKESGRDIRFEIRAGARHIPLLEGIIRNHSNKYSFTLDEVQWDVEIIMCNDSDGPVYLRNLSLE